AERQMLGTHGDLDFVEHVMDRLVTVRRHADPATAPHELGYQASACPCLSRSGRTLDEEIARIEVQRQCALLIDVDRLNRVAGHAAADARWRSREDVAQGAITSVVRQHRRSKACERSALFVVAERTLGNERARKRNSL